MYQILLILVLLTVQTFAIPLLFPISDNIHWNAISKNNLKCPIGQRSRKIEDGLEIPVKIPTLGRSPSIGGYLCTSHKLITTCDTGFFGGNTLSIVTNPVTLSEAECRDAVSRYTIGDIDDTEHPKPICSWMKSSSTVKKVINVIPTKVHYDPYQNKAMSILFLQGFCTKSFCLTVFSNKVWVSEESLTKLCTDEQLEPSTITIYRLNTTAAAIWSPDIDTSDPNPPCIMRFCGTLGLRFPSGNWVALSKQEVPKIPWVGDYFYYLESCPPSTRINIVDQEERLRYSMISLLDQFYDQECSLVVSKIREGIKVSRVEIQTLAPRSPGFHPVYKFTSGTLLVGLSHYKWVNATPMTHHPYVLFKDQLDREYHWTSWTQSNRSDIIEGPNGLYVLNKTLIIGTEDIDEYKRISHLSGKHTLYTIETELRNQSTPLVLPKSIDYQFVDDESILHELLHWSYKTLIVFIVVLLGVFVSVMWGKRHLTSRVFTPEVLLTSVQPDRETETEFFRS